MSTDDGAAEAIEGTYRWTITREDALAADSVGTQTPEGPPDSTIALTLGDGTWEGRGNATEAETVAGMPSTETACR